MRSVTRLPNAITQTNAQTMNANCNGLPLPHRRRHPHQQTSLPRLNFLCALFSININNNNNDVVTVNIFTKNNQRNCILEKRNGKTVLHEKYVECV